MATANPFDLLGDDDNDDPSLLFAAAQQQKAASKKAAAPAAAAAPTAGAKLPIKPLPPAQAVREARSNATPARGGGGIGRGGLGRGRGVRGGRTGLNRDHENVNANGFPSGGYDGGSGGGGRGGEDGDAGRPSERDRGDREQGGYGLPRQSYRGGRRGGYGDGEAGGGDSDRPPRRVYERRSGTGRGYEMKREGAGRGNWGMASDDAVAQQTEDFVNTDNKVASPEKKLEEEVAPLSEVHKDNKDGATNEAEEKEQEDKEMTLEEYEKIREEKRKALLAMKTEERKVDLDKDFKSMKQLSLKKGNDDVFIKLGSDKDAGKRKENADRDERVKKSVSINEFLKPTEGERFYDPGRGRGRGRGDRAPFRGGFGGGRQSTPVAPKIEDPGQFPTLGGK